MASSAPAAAEPSRFAAWAQQLTLADALVALIVLAAAALRFGNLGKLPLSTAEAVAALGSWQLSHVGATAGAVPSPAYLSLTSVTMLLFGSSDVTARLVPAQMGTLTAALVWSLRRSWREAGMVVAAAFLAVSPLNVLASRTAGGQSIAIFALMLLVVCGINLRREGTRRWAYGLGIALGLGFTSDPLFIGGLAALAPLLLWQVTQNSERDELRDNAWPSGTWRVVGLAAIVTFLLLGSAFFMYLPGLGSAFGIVASWLGAFGIPFIGAAGGSPADSLLVTLRYEPALVVLGVPALIWALAKGHKTAALLAGWWVLLILLALFQPGVGGNVLLFTVPGYLLVGLLARHLSAARESNVPVTLAVAAGLVLLGMVLLVSIGRYTRLALWSTDQLALLILALVAFLAAAGLFVLAMSYSGVAARQGVFLGLAVLLIYYQVGMATALTREGANDPRESIVTEGTDSDILDLAKVLHEFSWQTTAGRDDLQIITTIDTPVLRWYLRDYKQAQLGTTLPYLAQPAAVITAGDTQLQIGADYMGADYDLQTTRAAVETPFVLNDALKWLLFRESNVPLETQRIILWVRSDLAGAGGQ